MNLGAEPKKVENSWGLLCPLRWSFILSTLLRRATPGYKPSTARSGTGEPAETPGIAAPLDLPSRSDAAVRGRSVSSGLLRSASAAKPHPIRRRSIRRLRLEVLAKLQQVNVEGMHRSIFDFGQAPPPEPAKTAIAKGRKRRILCCRSRAYVAAATVAPAAHRRRPCR